MCGSPTKGTGWPRGLDHRRRGPVGGARPLDDDGCARYVVTDVSKDGTLRGPNLDLLRDVCKATDAR